MTEPSPFEPDPVIEFYKKDIDRTLLRENLKLTVTERFEKFERHMQRVYEFRAAGERARRSDWRITEDQCPL